MAKLAFSSIWVKQHFEKFDTINKSQKFRLKLLHVLKHFFSTWASNWDPVINEMCWQIRWYSISQEELEGKVVSAVSYDSYDDADANGGNDDDYCDDDEDDGINDDDNSGCDDDDSGNNDDDEDDDESNTDDDNDDNNGCDDDDDDDSDNGDNEDDDDDNDDNHRHPHHHHNNHHHHQHHYHQHHHHQGKEHEGKKMVWILLNNAQSIRSLYGWLLCWRWQLRLTPWYFKCAHLGWPPCWAAV